MPRLLMQGALAVAIIAAGLVVGQQLRASRERLGTGQAGSAASVQPTTAVPTPMATMQVTAPPRQATPAPAARTVVPTPFTTPYTGAKHLLSGTVTVGGAPVRGAQVMVFPSDPSNHGPTPVPPESASAITDARGAYQVKSSAIASAKLLITQPQYWASDAGLLGSWDFDETRRWDALPNPLVLDRPAATATVGHYGVTGLFDRKYVATLGYVDGGWRVTSFALPVLSGPH
ncbi:MAG TPA: hypothetical protein VI056_07675 [Candidatus Limnocylindria bacterium]